MKITHNQNLPTYIKMVSLLHLVGILFPHKNYISLCGERDVMTFFFLEKERLFFVTCLYSEVV